MSNWRWVFNRRALWYGVIANIISFDLFIKNITSHVYIFQGLWRRDVSISLQVLRDALEIRISRSGGIAVHTNCFSFDLLFCHKDVQKTRKSKYLKS